MTTTSYENSSGSLGGKQPDNGHIKPLSFSHTRLSLLTILLLAVAGWFSFTTVKQEIKNSLSDQLKITLSANVEALKIWIEDKKLDAEVLAAQPEIQEKIFALIDYAKNEDVGPGLLKETQELIWLREHLGAACEKYGFIGFVLLDSTGYQVGALLEEPVGKRQLIERSDFFYRSLQGDTVLSHPFPSEVDLPDINDAWHSNWPTMFASTPMRNKEGEIVGVLAFRIRPEIAFTRILEISRWGKTGETYAFNSDGLMISDSRFNPDLKKAGLIPDEPESRAILHMEIRDPGGNRVAGFSPSQPRRQQPLTLMAANATKGNTGINVDGYNDYRGIPILGAWTWLPDYHFGITTEIDRDEAFEPLNTITNGFLLIFGLLVVFTIATSWLHIRQFHIESERNLAHEQIKENEVRLQSLMDNAGDGIITINEQGIVETFNPAAQNIFGHLSWEIIGRNIDILIPESDRSAHNKGLQRHLATGKITILGQTVQVRGLRKDGTIFDLELSISKMTLANSIKFIGIVRDITDRKAAEEKLKAYSVELERSNKDLQDFAAIASHDLQEPLRKIITFGDRLQAMVPDLPQKGDDCLQRMQKAAERMQRLIDDLLVYSRVTTKAQPFKSVDLKDLVHQVLEDLEVGIKKSKGTIHVNGLPTLRADVFQMRQLFQNLISNSLKYHREGTPPVINVDCFQRENGGWKITLEDNGIGFDEKYTKKIFKPFERLHGKNEYEGTGMGLAICKKIVSRHGGTISVRSKPLSGTTFTIYFPAVFPSPDQREPQLV